MSKKETGGPVKLQLVGPDRCDVPGLGVVKPGDEIVLPGPVHCHGLPGWPDWWRELEKAKPAPVPEEEDDG